ncbi:MAG: pyrimidine 5'-nucleotidase [Janthinobacterium lividum]
MQTTPRRRAGNGRRANVAGRQRPGPIWLFDLDDTLHHASRTLLPAVDRAMTAYVARRLEVDHDTANHLRSSYWRRYGATLLGLIAVHGIDPHEFLREVHPLDDLAAGVHAERGLAALLRTLPGRKLILTNAPQAYALGVLEVLGIDKLFERVIAVEQMRTQKRWRAKPDRAVLRRILRSLGVPAHRVILVEDTHGHLKRYRQMGLKTVWMTGHLGEAMRRRRPGFRRTRGKPHYVDRRIGSLSQLRYTWALR